MSKCASESNGISFPEGGCLYWKSHWLRGWEESRPLPAALAASLPLATDPAVRELGGLTAGQSKPQCAIRRGHNSTATVSPSAQMNSSGTLSSEDILEEDRRMTRWCLWLSLLGHWAQEQEQLISVFLENKQHSNEAQTSGQAPLEFLLPCSGLSHGWIMARTKSSWLIHISRSIPASFLFILFLKICFCPVSFWKWPFLKLQM